MPRRLVARSGIWHYHRRVPTLFADVDPRTFVTISLDTRDLVRAEKLKGPVERELEAYWLSLKKGGSTNSRERYQGAIDRARIEGMEYRPAEEIGAGALADILKRLERLERAGAPGTANELLTEALLGGVEPPRLMLSTAIDEFYALTRDRLKRKSPDQVRRWKAPRLKAVNNLIALVGDKPLVEVTRSDALALRAWWLERVVDQGYTANSANKDIGHLAQLLDTLSDLLQLGLTAPFARLRLPDDDLARRAPFPLDLLKALVAGDALRGLNEEARGVLLVMIETGMRPSEICGLDTPDILVAHTVPHVKVQPSARELKTVYSKRDVPLVGISLETMRRFPDGFPRYRDRSSQLSATVNKYLRENDLLPTEEHSLYSIRHTFQDRIVAAEMPDRMQADLMGHKFTRPYYGEGPTLAHKAEWLKRLAVT